MESPYRLKQTVIVTKKEQKIDNIKQTLFSDTSFFGEIVAVNNDTQICIRRFNSKDSQHTDITPLQWINLDTDEYTVAEAIL